MASKILLSLQERKDLERYIRFFIYKAAQVIVQSRLGNRMTNKCKVAASGSEWFQLAITDLPEVLQEMKQSLVDVYVLEAFTVNIEIFLATNEARKMVLETWSITMDVDKRANVKVSYKVYQRLTRLLRSLICMTRDKNGYYLARNQRSDTFVICYRLYHGPPELSEMGDSFNGPTHTHIGSSVTPLGTVRLGVHCRAKLLFSPTNSYQHMDVRENYFSTEKTPFVVPSRANFAHSPVWTDEDVADGRHSCSSTPPTDYEIVHHPSNSPRKPLPKSLGSVLNEPLSSSDDPDSSSSPHRVSTPDKLRRSNGFAFAPRRASQVSLEEEVPFSILMEQAEQTGDADTLFPPHSPDVSTHTKDFSTSLFDDPEFMEQYKKPADDFILVDVKMPFAVPTVEHDIGRFYKKFHRKEDLVLLDTGETISETLEQLDLDIYENELKDFDEFCSQLDITVNQGSPV